MIADRVIREIAEHRKLHKDFVKPELICAVGKFDLYELAEEDRTTYYVTAKGMETIPALRVINSVWYPYSPALSDLALDLTNKGYASLAPRTDQLAKRIVALSPRATIRYSDDLHRAEKHMPAEHDQKNHDPKKKAGLSSKISQLKPKFAEAAQTILDEWEQDETGYDEVFGSGGVCDEIAGKIGGILADNGMDTTEGGQEGDDHAWVIAYNDTEAFAVDIPPSVYETGGGYNWKKRKGVKISPDDIDVYPVDRQYIDTGDMEKHLPGDHDQQTHNPHKIPADLINKKFFHATDNTKLGETILKTGYIKAPDDEKLKGRGYLTPVKGKVYIAHNPKIPVMYALGADMAGEDSLPEFMNDKGRYGYIFEIDTNSFHDLQPDEDSIGEMIGMGNAPQWLNDLAKSKLTKRQYYKVMNGEYIYWAQAGKKLVKLMTPEQKYELIRAGGNVAHHGELRYKRAFRLDKNKIKELKRDGSNLFDIAEEVAVKHLMGQHEQVDHNPHKNKPAGRAVFYHGTTTDLIETIRSEGIQPSTLTGNSVWGFDWIDSEEGHERAASVFITSSLESAIDHGRVAASRFETAKEVVVFEVVIPQETPVTSDEKDSNSFRLNEIKPEWIVGHKVYRIDQDYSTSEVKKSRRGYVTIIIA